MNLTERKKKVLRSVVDLYIRTAEPVGSKAISELPDMNYSSATIRNEMADLLAMGYLEQPHTSAGRIPSAAGYRLYVDELMADYRLSMDETKSINLAIEEKMQRVDRMMEKVAKLVSQATELPAISVTSRHGGITVQRVELILAGQGSIIAVVMLTSDEVVNKLIKLVFIENFRVSNAQLIYPAADISEQISTAGKEASGTGNMKFMVNGALTLGTMDGANVEMSEKVGMENIYIFGLNAEEVSEIWRNGYSASVYYNDEPMLRRVVEALIVGFNGESFADIANYLLTGSPIADPYMCMADYQSYLSTQQEMSKLYATDKRLWNHKALRNIAAAGFFAADRSIKEYAENIWDLKSLRD